MIIDEKNVVQQFDPLPKQKIFLHNVLDNPKAKFSWYVGGFGSGKSFSGSQAAIRLAMQAPNGRGLIGRSTMVDLKATTMKTFFEVCDKRLIKNWHKQDSCLTLINGHEIYFWGLDDIEKLKSFEVGWFWIDEVDEVDPEVFEVLMGRIRHKAQPKRLGLVTSNSEGKNWTYNLFIKGKMANGDIMKKKHANRFYTVKAPSTENTHLPEDYLETLDTYTGDLYARYVNASFDVFEGQIFKEFGQAHIIKPFSIPDDWPKIRGIDHGERNPTAVVWVAVTPEKDLVVYRDYAESNLPVKSHAEAVAELSEEETIEYSVIDPSVKSVRGQTGQKIDREWKDEMSGLEEEFMLKYGVNSVKAGIARMHKYMAMDMDREHPVTGKKGCPKIFVFDNCKIVIDEVESYKWAKKNINNENDPEEKPRKKNDHCLVGDTLVLMGDYSHKKIKDIVIGDEVIASGGKRKVLDSWYVGKENVIEVQLANGMNIKGTSEHRVYTTRGLVYIDDLRYNDSVIINANLCNTKELNITTTENITPQLEGVSMAGKDSTWLYGKKRMEKYLKGMLFITKTLTERITNLTIFNYLKETNIYHYTLKNFTKIIQNLLKTKLKRYKINVGRGINQKMAENGIANKQRRVGRKNESMVKYVKNVATNTQHISQQYHSIVTKIVKCEQEQSVYDITVDKDHNFFANGMLVHNCLDALRYVIMSRPQTELGTVHNPNSNNNKLLAIKPSKRDQVLPVTDKEIMDNLRKQHPEDFID